MKRVFTVICVLMLSLPLCGFGKNAAQYIEPAQLTKQEQELMALLDETRELLIRALLLKAGKGAETAYDCVRTAAKRSDKILVKMTELLRQRREDCDYNAGVGLLLGSLAAELEEIL